MAATHKKIILVVDAGKESNGLADKIRAEMPAAEYEIRHVRNFPDAMRWIAEMTDAPVAIVTDDAQANAMNGYQFIDTVRNEHAELQDVPIYFFEPSQALKRVPYPGVQGHYFHDDALVTQLTHFLTHQEEPWAGGKIQPGMNGKDTNGRGKRHG